MSSPTPARHQGALERLLGSLFDLRHRPWKAAALLLLIAILATNVYRAATQSVAHDEGVMVGWFLSGTFSQMLDVEHGNHHVVSELLAKLMVDLFGLSASTLRIPTLLGGLFYSVSVFAISAVLFGEGLFFLLSVAVLSLNPLVLDYLVCARGYGLALGFFFYSLYQVTRYLVEARPPRGVLYRAGIALGLAAGSNPIMIFPGGALAASLVVIALAEALVDRREPAPAAAPAANPRKSRKKRQRGRPAEGPVAPAGRSWSRALVQFVPVAVAVGGFFLFLPKQLIELEQGYMGPVSLRAILEGLARHSVLHSPSGFAGLAAVAPEETAIRFLTDFALPLLFVAVVCAGGIVARRWWRTRNWEALQPVGRELLLLAAILPANLAMVVASRHIFQKPYPELRTAMYWIPLLSLSAVCLSRWLHQNSGKLRVFAVALAVGLVVCVVQYATQYNTRYFAEWAYCAAGKEMVQAIRAESGAQPVRRVRVGVSWQLEPVVNFYRVAWRLAWMDPVYRDAPDAAFDYYLLMGGDIGIVERWRLKTLIDDRLSGVVLAKSDGS